MGKRLLIREGIEKILSASQDISLTGSSESLDEVHRLLSQQGIANVVVVDMFGQDVFTVEQIIYDNKKLEFVCLFEKDNLLFEILHLGINSYLLLNETSAKDLIKAVSGVTKGECHISKNLIPKIYCNVRGQKPWVKDEKQLTERELQLLKLIARGASNKSIAQKLYISEKTVKNHMSNIFEKIGVKNRTQAAIYIFERYKQIL